MHILEALARVTATSRISLAEGMDRLRTILPRGATLVVVTRIKTPTLIKIAGRLEQDGHSTVVVSIEEESPAADWLNTKVYA
jgi:hypothetical protein